MTNGMVFCLRFFGLVLSGVTTVFTVVLWSELPQSLWSQWLMGFAGFALEGCKFLLLVLSAYCFGQRRYCLSMVAGGLSLLLFIVSVGASVGFLEKSEQQARQSSLQWQQNEQSMKQLDQEIELLTNSARLDVNNGYRERALSTQEKLDDLRAQKIELSNGFISKNATSILSGVSGMAGLDADQVRFSAWLLLAVLIDGVAAACWVFLALLAPLPDHGKSGDEVVKTESTSHEKSTPVTVTASNIETVPDSLETVSTTVYACATEDSVILDSSQEALFLAVKQKIMDKVPGYDEKLSLKQLMRLESIGYVKARKVMDRIETEIKKQA